MNVVNAALDEIKTRAVRKEQFFLLLGNPNPGFIRALGLLILRHIYLQEREGISLRSTQQYSWIPGKKKHLPVLICDHGFYDLLRKNI